MKTYYVCAHKKTDGCAAFTFWKVNVNTNTKDAGLVVEGSGL